MQQAHLPISPLRPSGSTAPPSTICCSKIQGLVQAHEGINLGLVERGIQQSCEQNMLHAQTNEPNRWSTVSREHPW